MLKELGLLDLDGPPEDLSIERAHGRNDNTIVRCKGRGSYFIKRAYAADSYASGLLNYEAEFCRFCHECESAAQFEGLVPRIVAHDPDHRVFAYELFEEAKPLWNTYEKAPKSASAAVSLQVGRRLAYFHQRCSELPNDDARSWIPTRIPPAFTLHKPRPADLSILSAGAYKLISIVQQRPRMCERLDAVREQWEDGSILHGDIRSENVLVRYEDDSKRSPIVHFVDFETVQFGDPAWDVAGAFQDSILFWLYSMTPNTDVDVMIASATHSLSEIQTIVRAFAQGYAGEKRLEGPALSRFIGRAIPFAAVRMLQSAYETAADADDLPAPSVLLLQIAENVLNDPRGAARTFFGLPLD